MWYQEGWSKALVVAGVVIPLSSAIWLAVTLVNWMTFRPGMEVLGPIFQWTSALEACLRRFLVSKSVPSTGCWQLNSNSGFFDYIRPTSCQTGLIATQRLVGCVVLQNLFLG